MDESVQHMSTLITSLQTQLSSLLASQPGSGLEAHARNPAEARTLPPPVAVVQARAAAEALAVAQQAQRESGPAAQPSPKAAAAHGEEANQRHAALSPAQLRADPLAGLQLPSFCSFAQLRAAIKPAAEAPAQGAAAASPPMHSSAGESSAENSPPQPRALPASLQPQAGGFQWRPLS